MENAEKDAIIWNFNSKEFKDSKAPPKAKEKKKQDTSLQSGNNDFEKAVAIRTRKTKITQDF